MNNRMIKTLAIRHRVLSEPNHIPNTLEDYEEMRDIGVALAEYAAETGKDYNGHIIVTLMSGADSNVLNDGDLTTYVIRKVHDQSGLKAAAKLFLALDAIGEICPAQHERAARFRHE